MSKSIATFLNVLKVSKVPSQCLIHPLQKPKNCSTYTHSYTREGTVEVNIYLQLLELPAFVHQLIRCLIVPCLHELKVLLQGCKRKKDYIKLYINEQLAYSLHVVCDLRAELVGVVKKDLHL